MGFLRDSVWGRFAKKREKENIGYTEKLVIRVDNTLSYFAVKQH